MQEEKINKIREIVIKAVPSIIDYVLGCEVILSTGARVTILSEDWHGQRGRAYDCIVNQKFGIKIVQQSVLVSDFVEILGRKIGIAEILLAIKERIVKIDYLSCTYEEIQDLTYNIIIRWNLKEDDLTKQSLETIDFIHSLLTNN